MKHLVDLDRFPLDRPDSREYAALVARCRDDLESGGMFNLEDFLRPQIAQRSADALKPAFQSHAFTHKRRHNIYFSKDVPGLSADHPALREFETVNHTLCADQMTDSPVMEIYDWRPLAHFLSRTMAKETLYPMRDPLARVNAMAYYDGEALNWHFDRSEFTTTLLLQAPLSGGEFEYRTNLRSSRDPNFEGVARLLRGEDGGVRHIRPRPGTLNVFRGNDTPHRVTPVEGPRERIISVFSFFDRPDVMLTAEEQVGFYGRSA
ncbi:HalD/BesD family halogenase [Hoeflea sp.]|uniref:HalD/BesD family halogenase n=1 Tax=Hoeflea sp. TaxID=1940281 RepID=UPI003B01FFDA